MDIVLDFEPVMDYVKMREKMFELRNARQKKLGKTEKAFILPSEIISVLKGKEVLP